MTSKCFVPSCKNTVGIAFPDDPEIKEKWLEILGIPHMKPKPTSFVCLDHFQDDENEDESINTETGKISNNLKQATGSSTHTVEIKRTKDEPKDNESDENNEETDRISNDIFTDNSEILRVTSNSDVCRLCMENKPEMSNIFVEEIEESVPIVFAILACAHPIEISYEDSLPKTVCSDCIATLQVCFKFRSVCLKNDKIQKQTLKKQPQISPVVKKNKRKAESTTEEDDPKKSKIVEEEEEDENYDELEAINEFLVKKSDKGSPTSTTTNKGSKFKSTVSIDENINKMEEELRKVLEGTLSEEQAGADNIIIHIQNDDEEEEEEEEEDDEEAEEIIMNTKQSPALKRTIIRGDYSPKKESTEGSSTRGFKGGKPYQSKIGTFEGTSISYFYDVEFCLVNDYLFEYRLSKQDVRHMRCLLPSCSASAVQFKIEKWNYSNEVEVLTPHDHTAPTESEKKKQMFFYIMKRKMQSDKTLKFKNVYDDLCVKDPEIKDLIPLRNVINEICRHQFNHKIEPITSFDALFDHIEDDAYQKFQFNHNGAQFYQEKLTADDNAKAIIFANLETIEEMSDSDLMYIDASFRIETNEMFSYQLVTVLVWIEESYYPVMFALVNYKTQEIYKKIFEFLHDNLAPRLRPDEIVTEYESNLYYALGEIYVDSSIGGSVFYYTQNIYKQICFLNLSKDLETNTYFRNIYHMLLMLPLLPVNTILDGFENIKHQAQQLGILNLTRKLFEHIENEWLQKVTPDLFCVHRLENRINENVIAPFKKLRDYIMLSKGKTHKNVPSIMIVIDKLIELEQFLSVTYSSSNKKSFARDLSSAQKKNVLRAWQFIETHPKININNFFSRVLGYIKCMENQLWIWGFYRYNGDLTDELINASNFSIVSRDEEAVTEEEGIEEIGEMSEDTQEGTENEEETKTDEENRQIVMEAIIDENGGYVLQKKRGRKPKSTYVSYKEK